MGKVLLRNRILIIGLAAWAGLGRLAPFPCADQVAYGQPPAQKTSMTESIKNGFNNIFAPKPSHTKTPTDDPVSLNSKSKPGPELYAAIAKLYEESGKNVEAEQYYQMALKEKGDNLTALLGYARFQENQGRMNEALSLYQKAVQTHPKEAPACNNLGLCYARRGKLNEAAAALGQAVKLDPRNSLYRNNLATVLVDQNRLPEAFANFREVHGDAAAYYNIGYLLNKKGKVDAAEHNFAQALMIDPKMVAAQKWLNYLQNKSREANLGRQPGEDAIRMGSTANSPRFPAKIISPATSSTPDSPSTSIPMQNPTASPMPTKPAYSSQSGPGTAASGRVEYGTAATPQSDMPPLPPAIGSPQRLPPVSMRQPAGSMESFSGTPDSEEPSGIAPLPPGVR